MTQNYQRLSHAFVLSRTGDVFDMTTGVTYRPRLTKHAQNVSDVMNVAVYGAGRDTEGEPDNIIFNWYFYAYLLCLCGVDPETWTLGQAAPINPPLMRQV